MEIDVEKIKTAYEAASAEQKEQIERMFPGAFESAKNEDSEETLETLVDKLKAWQSQNKDKRVVALLAADKDRTEEEGNTAIYIGGSTMTLLQMTMSAGAIDEIKNSLAKLIALALINKVKDNLKDSGHGTDN